MSVPSALADLDAQLVRVAPLTAAVLAPGLDRAEILSSFGSIGLTPPDDLVEFFAWHNGRRPQGDGPYASEWPVGPRFRFFALDYLIERYVDTIEVIESADRSFGAGERAWFPFVATDSGETLVANVRGDAHKPAPVTYRYSDGIGPETPKAVTFEELIRAWTDAIATGGWTCEREDENTAIWRDNIAPDSIPEQFRQTSLL